MSAPTIDDTAIELEPTDLPEKQKQRQKPIMQYAFSIPKKIEIKELSIWKYFERAIPISIVFLGLANLYHAITFAEHTEGYRNQAELTEQNKRYTDLLFGLTQAQTSKPQIDQITMHSMLNRLNEIAEDPEVLDTLKVSDFLSLGNLNGNLKWNEKQNLWYDKAYKHAERDKLFDRRSSIIANLYHANSLMDSGKYKIDHTQIRLAMKNIKSALA